MKKLFFTIIAVCCIFSACQNPLIDTPLVPGGDAESRSAVPGNMSATQGGKRGIELRWDEVSGAVRYNIFKADSPLVPFVQCAETTESRFNFSVPAGSTVYYRVSAVAYNGQESARSFYVMGSSLAQPIITDITDITESSATVTWYMENATDATYRAHLRYTVYCLDKADSTEVAQLAIDGSQITANRATFGGLLAGKEYAYQVEAYLVYDQSNSEKSEIMDRETARRFVPGAPEKLSASRGTAKDGIELSFELPELVNIALGANEYKMHGIYFVISKRFYSENGDDEYQKVCAYFGAEDESSPNDASKSASAGTFESYEFGKTVTWTDTGVIRGVKYEYLVQSYVDGTTRTITADTSKAAVTGWTLTEATVSIGEPVYTTDADGLLNVSAALPLNFVFDPKGEEYRYKVLETIKPIGDEGDGAAYDLDGEEINRESAFLSYEQITAYVAAMDLTKKTTAASPGRGLYSYGVSICLPDGTVIDTVTAIGDVLISEDVDPVLVEAFAVQDGYIDKFLITWDSVPNTKYILFSSTDKTSWEEVDTYDENEPAEPKVLTGYAPGVTVYFAMQPVRVLTNGFGNPIYKKGQRVYLPEGAQTLGVPELLPVTGYSYSTVTAAWKEAQKADTYRVKYRYEDDGDWTIAATLSGNELSPDVTGTLRYSFKPSGHNNPAQSGKVIEIAVQALNEGLRMLAGSDEIAITSTENVLTRLVGPAKLATQASKAASAEYIEVSWNEVAGAGGYYVFRRQFNMADTAEERDGAVVYYIPALKTAAISVTGKELTTDAENTIIDTPNVKATASFTASRYTLKDEYMSDHEYSGGFYRHIQVYRDQQNELAWGFPYRYFIVPVLGNEPLSSIEFAYGKDSGNKNTAITSYTLRENDTSINYTGAAALEKTGFAIGFGQNVIATKGTYTSNPANSANDGIQIKWNAPPPLLLPEAGFSPQYVVYRRTDRTDGTWMPIITATSGLSYVDNPGDKTVAYEYAVGIYKAGGNANGTFRPYESQRFIAVCKNDKDERDRPNMLGFTLDSVRVQSVSRNEQKDSNNNFGEIVNWYSAGIKNTSSDDTNWGIDGYTVFVMNRNIDGDWHEIANISAENMSNQVNQSVLVTNVQGGATLEGGLLKVMRDYKHYFKVRSYALNNDGDKVYCTDPVWNYENLFSVSTNRNNQDRADFLQTDYVKWGARQITPTEFARIASLHIAWGVHNARGNAPINFQSTLSARWVSTSNNGSSGQVGCQSSSGVGKWWFYFDKYKPDLDTNANRNNWTYSTTFLMINADNGDRYSSKMIYGDSYGAGAFPDWYGRDGSDPYGSQYIDITGPTCVNGLYSGGLRYNGTSSGSALTWTGGTIQVIYPAGAAAVQISGGGRVNTPLPYSNQASHSATGDHRRTILDEWY
jgi:hypothetical protein